MIKWHKAGAVESRVGAILVQDNEERMTRVDISQRRDDSSICQIINYYHFASSHRRGETSYKSVTCQSMSSSNPQQK
jgi:hypothetical protein